MKILPALLIAPLMAAVPFAALRGEVSSGAVPPGGAGSQRHAPSGGGTGESPGITVKKQAPPSIGKAKQTGAAPDASDDDLDGYNHLASIADPLEPLNRGTFWLNHQLYRYVARPVSKTYDAVLPEPVRTGVFNVFDNLEFPVRFVNDVLQFKLKRAGQETGKFLVNSVAGVGGIIRMSDRLPALTAVPAADTGQTFAKWGIGQGIYIVLPAIGPKSLRDTVGLVGDYALYPVTWITFGVVGGLGGPMTYAVSSPDTARSLHGKLSTYDAVTQDTLDRYLAVRSAYIQNRKQAVLK